MITPPVPLKNLLAELTSDEDKMFACEDYNFSAIYDTRMNVLRDALRNPSKKTRERAVYLLGRIHTIESINILSEYSQHEKDFVCRLEAVRALTEMGDKVQRLNNSLVSALIPWISRGPNDPTDISDIARYSLQEFGEYSMKELIKLMTCKSRPVTKDDSEFTSSFDHPDDQLKLGALNVLLQMKNIGLQTWFDRAFEATESETIHNGLIGLAGHFEEKALVPALIKMLNDRSHRLLHPAISEALGEIGDSRAIDPLIEVINRHYTEYMVRKAAASALEGFANRIKVRDALAEHLSLDPDPFNEKVVEILYTYNDSRAVKYILVNDQVDEKWALDSVISVISDPQSLDDDRYENAKKSLCNIGGTKSLNVLKEVMEFEGPDLKLINTMLDWGKPGVKILNTLIENSDFCEETISMLVNTNKRSVIPCLEWALTIDDKNIQTSVKKALKKFTSKK